MMNLCQQVKPKADKYLSLQENKNEAGQREAWDFYLQDSDNGKSLLELEIACIEERKGLPKHSLSKVTLVILVGDSFEPLLQSIWVHEPTTLIPVVNTYYGNKGDEQSSVAQWAKVYGLMLLLPENRQRRIANLNELENVSPVDDDPTAVFEYLSHALANDLSCPQTEVVIDITGAKKTMVAGAFMLAAYTKAKIFYIDPEQYDDKGRPYGFSAVFRKLRSPLDELALHDWDEIRRGYKNYQFASALQMLKRQQEAMVRNEKQRPENPLVAAIESLQTFLRICADWDNGRLRETKSDVEQLDSRHPKLLKLLPTVVQSLVDYWPGSEETDYSLKFFQNPKAVILYAQDELQRAQRQAEAGNSRDAFMRAYALNETLLKARLSVLHEQKQLQFRRKRDGVWVDFTDLANEDLYNKMLPWLLSMLTGQASKLLRNPARAKDGDTLVWWKDEKGHVQWQCHQKPGYLRPELDLYKNAQNSELRKNRDKVTHSYFPVKEHLVQNAIKLAKKSLDNYCESWARELDSELQPDALIETSRFAPPDWDEVKQLCGLTFLPERSRVKNGRQ